MHEFKYNGKDLYCEGVSVAEVAEKIGTPFYLYSHKTLIDHYRKIRDAFEPIDPIICYSMKANSSLAICKALIKEGAGLDIVSGGELYKAMRLGADPGKIVYASVGKTPDEIRAAIKRNILLVNVESVPELRLINTIAAELKKRVNVAIRINPDVDAKTHAYITTGKKHTKFGIDLDQTEKIFDNVNYYSWLNITGLHLHIGSQITDSKPFVRAIKRTLNFIKKARIDVKYLDIGGGLGIVYEKEKPQTAKAFAKAVLPLLRDSGLKIILEPGRFIAGNAGILVTKVIYTKRTPIKNFVIVDAGMNDLMRPTLYHAFHDIRAVRCGKPGKRHLSDIVGPICESGDFLGKERKLPFFQSGELMAVFGAGAYGFSMASNYNSRPRVSEAMVFGDKFHVIRKRETYGDLVRGEAIPEEVR